LLIKGTVKLDKRTKNLAKRLKPGDIALIDHEDIDSTAARMLIDAGVKAVVNAAASCSGRYPNLGPSMLVDSNIYVLDDVGSDVFGCVSEGAEGEIRDRSLCIDGKPVAEGTVLTVDWARKALDASKDNLGAELEKFARNTLSYVTEEKSLLLDPTYLPDVRSRIDGRHVLVVVRGETYREDLAIIRTYIRDMKPVLIGVDGGADAIAEMGLVPDIIVGDMDSVSDSTLKLGSELIVHAYADGRAPGLSRVESLGLSAQTCSVPGTSEDLALLLAYEKGAELIVAVGTHSTLVDFLDKGRSGMSSTFLVRLKVGHRLVDAKGVSKLYRGQPNVKYVGILAVAAAFVLGCAVALSPNLQDRLFSLTADLRGQLWQLYARLRPWEWRN